MIIRQSFPTQRKASLIGKNAKVSAVLKELSLNHAAVISPRGAPLGTELELIFEIPASDQFITLSIVTNVIHKHNSGDDIYLKLEFENLSFKAREALKKYLDYKQRLRDFSKKPEF